jgi:hypothetical protein
VIAATRAGLSRALRAPGLVALLWLVKLALAGAFALPAWLALRSWIGVLPEADGLRDGLRLGILADLAELRPDFFGNLALSACSPVSPLPAARCRSCATASRDRWPGASAKARWACSGPSCASVCSRRRSPQ